MVFNPFKRRANADPATKADVEAGAPSADPAVVTRVSRGTIPESRVNPLSRLFFQWVQPLMSDGFKRTLENHDLFDLDNRLLAKNQFDALHAAWIHQRSLPKPSLVRALNSVYGRIFWPMALLKFIGDMATVTSPILLTAVTSYVEQSYQFTLGRAPNPSFSYGIALPFILFAVLEIGSLSNQHFFHIGTVLGCRIRAALITNVYHKAMVLSGKARQQFPSGKLTNLMSTDASRIDTSMTMVHSLYLAPIQILVGLGLLINAIGPSALAGFSILFLASPLQAVAMRKLIVIRRRGQLVTDRRVRLTQEILQGIRIIKFFAWESSFFQKLVGVRNEELVYARILLIVRTAIQSFAMALPIFASVLSLIIYAVTGNPLTASVVFTALALFNAVRLPLMFLPMVIAIAMDALVSVRRMQDLLMADELEDQPKIDMDAPYAIQIKNGEFQWEVAEAEPAKPSKADIKRQKRESKLAAKSEAKKKNRQSIFGLKRAIYEEDATGVIEAKDFSGTSQNVPSSGDIALHSDSAADPLEPIAEEDDAHAMKSGILRDIDLKIPRGTLIAVVGPVGSGKSSLLNALASEMRKLRGEIIFGGSVGYCPQTAWIQNATVKNNILFGLPYDERKYRRVLRDCALEHDLEILPDGDETEIGERGVTLSGGQKQRINIARAVYFNADIVLLDDPLSAVDSHVGRHLFEKCFLGALAGKTRVLVTHQLHFLPQVDMVVVMDQGRIVETGTCKELMDKNGTFSELMRNYGGADDDDTEEVIIPGFAAQAEDGSVGVQPVRVRVTKTKEVPAPKPKSAGQDLMTKEERAVGSVAAGMYWTYFKAAGGVIVVLLILGSTFLGQASRVINDLWLSWWSSDLWKLSLAVYITIYAVLGIVQTLVSMANGVFVAVFGLVASKNLHHNAAASVIRAPSSLFDTTPVGRILNRFSKDVDATDYLLADSYRMFLMTIASVVSTFLFVCVIFPIFIAPLVPLLGLWYFFQRYYRATARELKRLDSLTRSPLYAHFSESMSGLSTIRAYRVQERFLTVNQQLTDLNTRAYVATYFIQRWLGVRLESIANGLTFFVMLFAVLARYSISPSIVGLVISYSLQVAGVFNWAVRQMAEVETNMNAVERLDHYIKHLDQEAPAEIPDHKPPAEWPSKGSINFRGLEMRYRPDLPRVLHGIDLSIDGGQKIGVVGRTGSGKSSIMMALFRMVEASAGNIEIDGVDIGQIGLHDLRSKLAIIPQDPTLFSGTFRFNLDPFGRHTDQELWDALARADMKTYVSQQTGGLEAEVTEGGENLSAGQRQLVCLARAMLIKARILVMDEATASVDLKTDALLQRAIREDFTGCTILTIAHRLNTVIDYDRILVLDNGSIKEFGAPNELLQNESGVFASMVNETGDRNAAMLRAQAKGEQVVEAYRVEME